MSELKDNLNKILDEKNEKLIPENLRKGITCLGVEGTLVPNTNDATATENDILEGKTAYAKEELITGVIPNNRELIYTPSEEEQSIPEGYASKITVNGIDIEQLNSYKNSLNIAQEILPGLNIKSYIKYNNTNAYTNLGITPNNKYKYEIHFDDSIGQRGTDVTLFGSWAGNSGLLFEINNPYRIADSRIWTATTQAYKPGQHILIISNELGCVLDNEQIQTANIAENNRVMYLNKANGYGSGFNGKIFEFIVYDENEKIIFDAVPDESGTFKDKISDTLLVTSGDVEYGYDNWTGYKSPTYIELEYIEGNGNSYINTGIIPTHHGVKTKYQQKPCNNMAIFGCSATTYHVTNYKSTFYYTRDTVNRDMHINISDYSMAYTDLMEIEYNIDGHLSFNGTIVDDAINALDNSKTVTLFKRNQNDNAAISTGTCYYFQIYDNNNVNKLVLDLIPAISSYGQVGMYDKISKKFYGSMTNNNFIAGPEIGPIEEG